MARSKGKSAYWCGLGCIWPHLHGINGNIERVVQVINKRWVGWIINTLFLGLGIGLFILMTALEPVFYPVIDVFKVEKQERTKDSLTVSGSLHKQRNCVFVGVIAHAYNNGEYQGDLNVSYPTRHLNGIRPVGDYGWGPIILTRTQNLITSPMELNDIDSVNLHIMHQCNPFWISRSHVANLKLEPLL